MDAGMRFDFKNIAKDAFYYLGMPKAILRFLQASGHPRWFIFTYHRISRDWRGNDYIAIPRDVFEAHIKFIKNNFKTVSMFDGLKGLEKNDSKEIYATINLDDGYRDNYLYAYPILKKYNVPATIFLTTDFIGKTHRFWWDRVGDIIFSLKSKTVEIEMDSKKTYFNLNGWKERKTTSDIINRTLRDKNEKERERFIEDLEGRFSVKRNGSSTMLDWDEVRKMHGRLVSFGAHTKTHPNLCLLKDEGVLKEVIESKKEIEKRLGVEVGEFLYPFGAFDERIRALVEQAGFKCARATSWGFNHKKTHRFLLNHVGADCFSNVRQFAARTSVKSMAIYFKRER